MAKPSENSNAQNTFPIVGIGASAGGLKAFETFFKNLDAESGMAFVLVQHLDPNHRSELAGLLQNHTSMPVTQVEDSPKVEPNCVYIIPPNKHLEISGGKLRLSEREQRGSHAMIDLFFRSLAEDQGANAVCVILSGTGTDGTQGLKAIKEKGGLTFAQREEDAEYDGMPRSAAATGLVDFVLDVAQIPGKLVQVKSHAETLDLPDGESKLPEDDSETLQKIFGQLRSKTGHDFSYYKRNTVFRRIGRRLQVLELGELSDYLAYLRDNSAEVDNLFRELLISVTNFFRDKQAFETFERRIIPKLFGGEGESVRVWVTGCATGEEAYSVAMLLSEANARQPKRKTLQVFASDIDERALEFARRGVYPNSVATDVSKERLKRFFTSEGDHYRVNQDLRENVLFTAHNLIKDPPFSRLDLVTCRNLLIYLDNPLQERVFNLFHYALKENGYLFLGASESLGKASNLFGEVDRKAKLFVRRDAAQAQASYPFTLPTKDTSESKDKKEDDPGSLAKRFVLKHYAPTYIVVNDAHDIAYTSGRTGKYLEQPEGEPTQNVVQLARGNLSLELRSALYRLFRRDKITEDKRVSFQDEGDTLTLSLTVRPLEDETRFAIIVLEERAPSELADVTSTNTGEAQGELARQLEDELRSTRESLQTTIEELETSNEELRASNEELQSMNEETKSTAEELETSREELQSTNEELVTVNQELRNKIEELNQSNSDLENLIASTDIGTLFLDSNLRLKRYTPRATEVFNLISEDVGRPFGHVSHNLRYNTLEEDVTEVLETLHAQELELESKDGAFYIVKLLPYRTVDNRIDGVVVTLFDVTELEAAQRQAERRAQQQDVVARLGQQALAGVDAQVLMDSAATRVAETLDADFCKVLKHLPGEGALLLRAGVGWREGLAGTAKVSDDLDSQAGYTLHSEEPVVVETFAEETRFSGSALLSEHRVVSGISVIIEGQGRPYGVLGVHTKTQRVFSQDDVTFVRAVANVLAQAVIRHNAERDLQRANEGLERRVAERTEELQTANTQLREQRAFLQSIYNEVSLAVYVMDAETMTYMDVNPAFERFAGVGASDVEGKTLEELLKRSPIGTLERHKRKHRTCAETNQRLEFETNVSLTDEDMWWFVTLNPVADAAGKVYRIIGTALPITERKEAELALQREKEFTEQLISSSVDGVLAFDFEHRYTVWNPGMERMTGMAAAGVLGEKAHEVFPFLEEIGEMDVQRATLAGERPRTQDQPYTVLATGQEGFFSANYAPLHDDAGGIVGGLAMVRDTTARKEAEDELRASEERFRAVFEQGSSATCLLILDRGVVTDVNAQCEAVLGYARGELMEASIFELDIWQDEAAPASLKKMLEAQQKARLLELTIDKKNGGERFLHASLEIIEFGGEGHALLILEDVTERRRVEEELATVRRKLGEIREEERIALARDLHDDAIQELIGIAQGLALSKRGKDAAFADEIQVHRDGVLRLVSRLRHTIGELRTPGLEELGLKNTLEIYAKQVEEASPKGPDISLDISLKQRLPLVVAQILFRVVQEALRNTLKHADASEVCITLSTEQTHAALSVSDDGAGFEVPERLSLFARDRHFGLVGLEEQVVGLLAGNLEVHSEPGEGTTLRVNVPLKESASRDTVQAT